MSDDRKMGAIASRVLFENERIRVWEMKLAPGERSDLHRHDHDYVMIQLDGDKVAADFEPDSQDVFGGADLGRVEGEVAFGNVIFAEKGGIETAINIGQKTFHEFVVELLD
ncbi:MAG: hypothetical protein KDB21_15865 [Acidimicrobiales bacterium]|nr:hypothetical protein [Acidimicrobiales bacterium]